MREQPCLLQVVGILLVLFLIIAIPISFWLFNLGRIVFDHENRVDLAMSVLPKTELISVVFFKPLENDANAGLGGRTVDGDVNLITLLQFMDEEDWQLVQSDLFPPAVYEPWVEEISASIDTWLISSAPYPDATLVTANFKEQWNTAQGQHARDAIFNALPSCTLEDVDEFLSFLNSASPGADGLFRLCQLPQPWRDVQYQLYQQSFFFLVSAVPEEIHFPDQDGLSSNTNDEEAYRLKNRLSIVRFLTLNALFLPGMLLLLITIVMVRDISSWVVWWGIPAFFGGLLMLPIPLVQRWFIPQLVLQTGQGIPAGMRGTAVQAMIEANGSIFNPLYWQAGLLIMTGFLLLVTGIATRSKKPTLP